MRPSLRALTDSLVQDAQQKFLPVFEKTGGDAGWVSFELDPLLEDPLQKLSEDEIVQRYVSLGKQWAEGHRNRMIKVPATSAGLQALEPLAAAGITLNVTLIFTQQQYRACPRIGLEGRSQTLKNREHFKSVYSIFISRIDVYTRSDVSQLSADAQGMVGLLNAKRIWQENQAFWADKNLPLAQELIFASTGTKDPNDPPYKYVQALAGSDIQTNPPETNQAVVDSGITFKRTVDQMPSAEDPR